MLKADTVSTQRIDRIAVLLFIGWSLTLVFVSLFHIYGNRDLAVHAALVEAKNLLKHGGLNRVWHANKASGDNDFALLSHVEVAQRMYQNVEENLGYRVRIVLLDSDRPESVPDVWERIALRKLFGGEDSFHEISLAEGVSSLRLIQSARISESCLVCHVEDYRLGDLAAGISLSIPLGPYYAALGTPGYSVLVVYLIIWAIGLFLTYLTVRLFKNQLDLSREQESQLQLVETNLHYISYFDPITNLPNRATFDDRLRVAIAHAERLNKRIAVAVVNIENFTQIRDLFSRGVSDVLIRQVAEVVAFEIRPDDTVARMGNDRLLLLLPGLVSRENVARIVNNINEAFVKPIELDGAEIKVKVSFGVSIFPDDSLIPDQLVSHAETASSRVKHQKVSNLQMFSESLNAAAHAHLQLETGLRQGLNRNEFVVYYQPQIDAPSGTVIGAEALIRWNHPELGFILPDKFIPMAENNGAIVPIGEWVLSDACKQAVVWQQSYNIPFRIGVNVSARQFTDATLVDVIDRVLAETGIAPEDLEIEVTEGAIMEDVTKAIEMLLDLKVRGVKVAIDDFGTGYSSLGQLKKLPFDRLKVDRSFVDGLDNDRDSQVIVEMIIELAAKLNMEIIAEGIETEAQKKFLISRGCYPMQGYFFAKPMPADEFTRFLDASKK